MIIFGVNMLFKNGPPWERGFGSCLMTCEVEQLDDFSWLFLNWQVGKNMGKLMLVFKLMASQPLIVCKWTKTRTLSCWPVTVHVSFTFNSVHVLNNEFLQFPTCTLVPPWPMANATSTDFFKRWRFQLVPVDLLNLAAERFCKCPT